MENTLNIFNCGVCESHLLYRDRFGEYWTRKGDIVYRLRDACIGGWFDGKGFERMGDAEIAKITSSIEEEGGKKKNNNVVNPHTKQ